MEGEGTTSSGIGRKGIVIIIVAVLALVLLTWAAIEAMDYDQGSDVADPELIDQHPGLTDRDPPGERAAPDPKGPAEVQTGIANPPVQTQPARDDD